MNDGNWSNVEQREVSIFRAYNPPQIVAAEYYFDLVRSYGNGMPREGSFDSSIEDIQFAISLPNLDIGSHYI